MSHRIAYFDCFSGISGNMTLGALLACGLSEAALREGLQQLHLPGWDLAISRVQKCGIAATHVHVDDGHHAHDHGHHHPHRGLGDILTLIAASGLPTRVRERASAIFTRLGEAEARVHGTTPDQVHFHEVGAVDAIVDIVGTAIGLEALGVERVVCSPLPLGSGWVTCAHGEFPVPAPAVAELVKDAPTVESDIVAELVTPTGAAIVTTLTERFGPLPGMTVRTVGYGAGTRDLARPNVLRLFIGESAAESAPTEVVGLECNLDDVTGEVLGYLMDRLFAAGALDVFYTAIQMKKNRPGVLVRVLCTASDEAVCTGMLFAETTTLGVRRLSMSRVTLPRASRTVETPYGPVRVKESEWNGEKRAVPEYEDCRARAEACGVPLRAVMAAAQRSAAGPGASL
jgi:pyridinium-3,5-bisthiocarboxylic acid mononucleotide nickel chelatase